MSYDSAPASALAQGYFVQALALAQAGNDRMLGASILDAMSHQATFTGRSTEAATLARAAQQGTPGIATPTLTAHFHAMEARALARLRDAKACGHALAESCTASLARPRSRMQWPNSADSSDSLKYRIHIGSFWGLLRSNSRMQHAGNALGASGEFVRSDFFVSLVLADAHLAAGDMEQACNVALHALTAGEQIRSTRRVSYLREFTGHLPSAGSRGIADFREQAAESRLWRIAARSDKPSYA